MCVERGVSLPCNDAVVNFYDVAEGGNPLGSADGSCGAGNDFVADVIGSVEVDSEVPGAVACVGGGVPHLPAWKRQAVHDLRKRLAGARA